MKYVFSDIPLSATMMAKSFADLDVKRDQIISFLVDNGYIVDIRTATEFGLEKGVQYKYSDTGSKWPVYDKRIQQYILNNIDIIKNYETEMACSNTYATKISEEGTVIVPSASITEFVENNSFDSKTAYKALLELGYVIKNNEGKGYVPTESGLCKCIAITKNKRGFKMIVYPTDVQREVLNRLGITKIKEAIKQETPKLDLAPLTAISVPDGLILSEYPLLDIDNFVVIDTETTGMTADDEVIELAVVDMDGTVLYDSTFCPVTEVNRYASAVNHLTNDCLCDSPKFADEWSKIKALIGNRKILAHNAKFDKRAIKQTIEKYSSDSSVADLMFSDCYDSVNIVKEYIDLPSYSLENIAQSLGISRVESHRAADDCIMTLEVLTRLELLLGNTK